MISKIIFMQFHSYQKISVGSMYINLCMPISKCGRHCPDLKKKTRNNPVNS